MLLGSTFIIILEKLLRHKSFLGMFWIEDLSSFATVAVRGHGSNVEQRAFWFKCGTAPAPPFVLQMDGT
jgi:hypothetical protein